MTLFDKFINLFNGNMEVPGIVSIFHIVWVVLIGAITFFVIKFFKNCNEKVFRRICLITWIILLITETLKLVVLAFDIKTLTYSFQWWAFPFQFCSSILYVLPLIVFLKEGKVRDAIISFTAYFVLFAGILGTVIASYGTKTYLNHQTMIHHGSQIMIGLLIIFRNKEKTDFKFWTKSHFVFLGFLVIAVILNEALYKVSQPGGINMFYISRLETNSQLLLGTLNDLLPWPLYLAVYTIGFVAISLLVFAISKGFKIKKK